MSDKKRAPKKVTIDYKNGKIYKLVNDVNDMIYIGSTTQTLSRRLTQHKSSVAPDRFHIAMKEVGKEHFRIILIELFPCTCKSELVAREYAVMNEFSRDKLYNGIINGVPDANVCQKIRENQKWTDETRQKMRDNSAMKGKFGRDCHHFKRGSVMEFTLPSGQRGFKFIWRDSGKRKVKTFSFDVRRTRQNAYLEILSYREKIYSLTNTEYLQELPFAE